MTAPASATQQAMPDWTNLVDNWRDVDAEWLRNRSIQIYATTAARDADAVLTAAKSTGFMSSLVALPTGHPGGPDFYNGSAWESVRYPNLNVISDGTSVTLRRQGAGTGVQLVNDGSVNVAKLFTGTGGVGITGDNTGVAIKVGAKTVKLATDATQLTIDSPVSIAGALTLTGALTAPSISVPSISATTSITTPQLNAANVTATAAVQGATVTAGTVQLAGNQLKATGGTAAITLASDSSAQIAATLLTVGNERVTGTLEVDGVTSFVGQPNLALTGKASVMVAGIIAVSGNVAPTQNAPDGTLYVTY